MYQQMSAYCGSVYNGKDNHIPIIAECTYPTPLESLIPNVLFVTNEIEVLDRLHVSQPTRDVEIQDESYQEQIGL